MAAILEILAAILELGWHFKGIVLFENVAPSVMFNTVIHTV